MIDLIFNGINFCVLGVVIFSLFKKHIYPSLREQRSFEQISFKNLFKRHEELLQEKNELEKGAVQQQHRFEDLSQKIAVWRTHIETKKEWYHLQSRAQEAAVHTRRKKQQEEYSALQLQAEVVPQALAQAKQELELLFKDNAAQRAYMQKILTEMHSATVIAEKQGRS